MTEVLVGVALHDTVIAALREAWTQARPHPVDTRDLLVALMRADMSTGWSRIWLDVGDIAAITRKLVVDPARGGTATWSDVELTDTCATALGVAWRLAYRYHLWPIPAGAVALGLVADDGSAAAQALRDRLSRSEMLALLQSEVLRIQLGALDRTLPALLAESRYPVPVTNSPPRIRVPPSPPPPPVRRPLTPAQLRQQKRNRVIIPIALVLFAILAFIMTMNPYNILDQPGSKPPPPATVTTTTVVR